ncbi:sugar phosphate isomerase/epimerase family protein [Neolewinella agarilytica]|nr:TIM barrel protein [Neolewinella agarilytica]
MVHTTSSFQMMDRRQFLNHASLLTAAALLPTSGCSMSDQPQFKMGYQLFSVREDMAREPIDTLRKLTLMGYEDFEIYGFDADANKIYGHSPTDFRKVLDDLNITTTSGHFGFHPFLDKPLAELDRYVDQCIDCAKALGMPYITWPWMAPEQRSLETFKRLPEMLNRIGERVSAAGLGFAYHNHDFEFVEYDGQTGYDIILRETDPNLVKLQIDMYWVMHSAKQTPKELIASQPGRFVMWHIKDMHKLSRDYTELGNGSINYVEVLPDPTLSGLEYYYLEQGGNYTHNAMQSAKDSADFFKEQLQRFL